MQRNEAQQKPMQQFMSAYKPISMSEACRRWLLEREVKEFLAYSVGGGVVLGDLLLGGGVRGQISPELLNGFQNLMGEKADSIAEIETLLLDKLIAGDDSVMGMISKIKGQIGEDYFVSAAGEMGLEANLAESGSQEGWDVALGDGIGHAKQYIQVKTYESADGVILKMKEVAEKVDAGIITDGDAVVRAIDFAVPHDIYAEVVSKAAELGLSSNVVSLDLTAAEASEIVQQGFNAVGLSDLNEMLSRFAVGSGTAVALHAVIAAYLMRKHNDESGNFLKDVSTQGAISSGGIATALLTESTLKVLGFATGSIPAIGAIVLTSMVARGVFSRILSREHYAEWLVSQTDKLKVSMQLLEHGKVMPSLA
ncbi:MAG: hypothetical protein PHX61_10250 [Alphaproteobacteria bacterium]|nr:hypothetical protein [Alphaproteobacteria bacterium]